MLRRTFTLIAVTAYLCLQVPPFAAGAEPTSEVVHYRAELKELVKLGNTVKAKPAIVNYTGQYLLANPSVIPHGITDTSSAEAIQEMCGDVPINSCMLFRSKDLLSILANNALIAYSFTAGSKIQLSFDNSVSVWSNKDIRNGWDKFKEISDYLAPVAMIAGAAMMSNENIKSGALTVAGGSSVFLLGNLAKYFGGSSDKERGKKLNSVLVTMEVSRTAYENSKITAALLNSHSKVAKDDLEKLKGFFQEVEKAAYKPDSDERKLRIIDVATKLLDTTSSFQSIDKFTIVYRDDLMKTYTDAIDKIKAVAPESPDLSQFQLAKDELQKNITFFNEAVKPFTDGIDDQKSVLNALIDANKKK